MPNRFQLDPVRRAMVSPRKNDQSPTRGTEPTPARSVCRKKIEARKGARPRRTLSIVSVKV